MQNGKYKTVLWRSFCVSLIIGLGFPFGLLPSAKAAVPQVINYQSRLRDASLNPITALTNIQYTLYDHPTNGAFGDAESSSGPVLWKEVHDGVSCPAITPDADGYFAVQLGACVAFPSYIDFNDSLYLGVRIGADAEAAPRVLFAAHPYSLNAETVDTLHATTTATPNQLLALDNNLNFNISTGTFYGGGLLVNGSSTLQNLTFTVATGTSLELNSFLAIGAIRLDAVGTSNVSSGAYLVGVFDEFDNSNATTVQGALRDLDIGLTAVSSSLSSFDLQAITDNGNTTTNAIQFAGGTSTAGLSVFGPLLVGTSTPNWDFHVYSDSHSVQAGMQSAGIGDDAQFNIITDSAFGYLSFSGDGGSNYFHLISDGQQLDFTNGFGSVMNLAPNGMVGLGVSPTIFKLEVAGHAGPATHDTYDLGSATTSWRNIYAGLVTTTELFVNGQQVYGGSTTLDTAYDGGGSGAGRFITADSGPITITGLTFTQGALNITNTTDSQAVYVNNTGAGNAFSARNMSTGAGFYARNQGSGPGVRVDNNAAGGLGIWVDNVDAGTALQLDNRSSGLGLLVNNSGSSFGGYVLNTGSGIGLNIQNSSSTGMALYVRQNDGQGLVLDNNTAGHGINVTNNADGNGIYVSNDSAGTGLRIYDAVGKSGIYVDKPTGDGNAISIYDNGSGNSLNIISASSGAAIWMRNTGVGESIFIEDASSDSSPFVLDADGRMGVSASNTANFMLTVGGSAGPSVHNAYDLGSATASWRNIYAQMVTTTQLFVNGQQVYGGSTTLDTAYDGGGSGAGRFITADAGPITITGLTYTQGALNITNTTDSQAVYVNNTGVGNAFSARNMDAGSGFYSRNQGSGDGFRVDNGTNGGRGLYVENNMNGTGAVVNNTGGGDGVTIEHAGNRTGLRINNTGAGRGAYVRNDTGTGFEIDNYSDTYYGMHIHNRSTGYGMYVQSAGGSGIYIDDTGSKAGLKVNTIAGTGNMIELTNGDDARPIYITHAGTQEGFWMRNTGTGPSLWIEDQNSEDSPFVLDERGNLGVSATNTSNFALTVGGDVGPAAHDTYDLGSSEYAWRNLYTQGFVSTTALYVNGLLIPTSTGSLQAAYDAGRTINTVDGSTPVEIINPGTVQWETALALTNGANGGGIALQTMDAFGDFGGRLYFTDDTSDPANGTGGYLTMDNSSQALEFGYQSAGVRDSSFYIDYNQMALNVPGTQSNGALRILATNWNIPVLTLAVVGSGNSVQFNVGTSTPEGRVTADSGSVFHRVDGTGGDQMYVKTTDGSTTGWVSVLTASSTLAEVDTLQTVTNRGNSTTNTIQFAGGTSTAPFVVYDTNNPTQRPSLEVYTNQTGNIFRAANSDDTSGIGIGVDMYGSDLGLNYDNGNHLMVSTYFGGGANYDYVFLGDRHLTVRQTSGFVGVGTDSPLNRLDVMGAISIASSTPATSTYALYNLGGELYWNGIPISSASSLVDSDGDTKVEVEASPDEDIIRFSTSGTQRMYIGKDGRVGIATTEPLVSMLTVGPDAHESSSFSVSGIDGMLNIANFRDKNGENVFRAAGSVADNDLVVGFGDLDYGGLGTSIQVDYANDSINLSNSVLRFYESSPVDYVGFIAPASLTTSTVWTLPSQDGSTNQILVTNGSGTLSWATSSDLGVNIYSSDGYLAGDRTVHGNGVGLNVSTTNGGFFDADIRDGTDYAFVHVRSDELELNASNGTTYGGMVFNSGGVSFTHNNAGSSSQLYIGPNMTFTDGYAMRGVVYAADYSANYNDRTLVDKGYVDGLVVSSTGALTLQQVTDNGNSTTNTIQFAGATSTGDFVFSTGGDAILSVARAANNSDGNDLVLNGGNAGAFPMAGNTGGHVVINGGTGAGFPATPGNVFLATERGRVGIGSFNANTLLHVQGGSSGAAVVTIDSDDGSGNGEDAGIVINSDYAMGSDAAYVVFKNNGVQSGKLYSAPGGSGFMVEGGNPFDITVSGTTRFILDGIGNLGLSTSSPAYRLDVVGDARVSAQLMLGRYALNPASGNQAGALIYNTASSTPFFWNGSNWVSLATGTTPAQLWQINSNILSPTTAGAYQVSITNNSNSTLTGFKAVNTNDANNYAGAVIELKGSGADFTNNLYFGKYGAGFYIPSWAGNGVLATDKNLVIGALGNTSQMVFQVTGGYTTPLNVMTLTKLGMAFSTGTRVNAFYDDVTLSADSSTAVATQHAVKTYVDNRIASSTAGLTLQAVTDNGQITTDWIQFAGATSTADFTLNGSLYLADGERIYTGNRQTIAMDLNNNYFAGTGNAATTGIGNVGVGVGALAAVTTGQVNTAVGTAALQANTEGNNNQAFGYLALRNNTTGSDNSAIGRGALDANIDGNFNIALGNTALVANTSGSNNVGIGYAALDTNTIGTGNVALGHGADVVSNNLTNAIAIGYLASVDQSNSMALGGTGAYSVNVGIATTTPGYRLDVVGSARVSAQFMLGQYALNPATGTQAGAMVYNTASSTPFFWNGSQWVALGGSGASAGSLWDADHDTGIQVEESTDEDIIRFDTAGTEYFTISGPRMSVLNSGNSVFLGQEAGRVDDLTTNNNVFIGRAAGYSNTTGFSNVYIGYQAGYSATNKESTTAVGAEAGRNNTGAFGNTMLGYYAGRENTGNDNVFIGYESGVGNTGSDNFFMGRGTGWNNIGGNNIMMGYFTGYDNQGSNNIMFGTNAGSSNKGSNSILMGTNAGFSNIGNDNLFFGAYSGNSTATGTRNVFIGRDAGYSNVLGNNSVFLGYQAGYSETSSNRLYIENSNSATPLVYGEFDNDVLRVNGRLQVGNPSSTGFVFPVIDGSSGQLLVTDGNGVLSWVSASTTEADTLQTVTNRGATTTNAIQFAGGTSTGNFVPSVTNSLSLGSTSNRWSDVWTANLHLGTSTWDLGQSSNGGLAFNTSGSEKMRITNDGFVGIGTNAPTHRLDILSKVTADDLFRVSAGDNGGYLSVYMTPADDRSSTIEFRRDLHFYSSGFGSEMLSLTNDAIGINTDAPTQALSVVGDAIIGQFDGMIYPIGGTNHSLFINAVDGQLAGIQGTANLVFQRNQADLARLGIDTSNRLLFQDYNGASWDTNMTVASSGNVGIGTLLPGAKLQINADNSASDVNLLKFQSSADSDIQSEIYFASGANATYWDVNSSGAGGALILMNETTEISRFLNNGIIFNQGGNSSIDFRVGSVSGSHALFVDASSGHVGMDQTLPQAQLHVGNTTAGSAADYNYLRLQGNGDVDHGLYLPNGSNLMVWDYNMTGNGGAIEFRNNGSRVGMFTNTGLVINDGGVTGIGLRVEGDTNANLLYTDAANDRVGVGTNAPQVRLHATQSANTVAAFDRTTDDGTIVSIRQDGVEEGTISVSANTVSYNAFTGSHYAWASLAIEKGMLVRLTGLNRRLHDNPDSEIVYGIEQTNQANDERVLGAYLSILNPSEDQSSSNPSLVMAVGNGEVWIVDGGEDVKAGDYLISSEISGHAAKDARATEKSYVVARAAEDVVWSDVSQTIDGRKHKLVSVFFENFTRDNSTGALLQGQQTGEQLSAESTVVVEDYEFQGRVVVKGHMTFGGDSVGQAKILSGQKEVRVIFDEEYATQPIVTVTPLDFVDTMYRVADVNTKGFIIQLNSTQGNDKLFNWHAFGNDDGKVFVSDGSTSTVQVIVRDDFLPLGTPVITTSSTTETEILEVPTAETGDEPVVDEPQSEVATTESVADEPLEQVSESVEEAPQTTEPTIPETSAPPVESETASGSGFTELPVEPVVPEDGAVTP